MKIIIEKFINESTNNLCKIVYERVINVVTSAHWLRSENYYVKLHFLKTLNYKILWREFWE